MMQYCGSYSTVSLALLRHPDPVNSDTLAC